MRKFVDDLPRPPVITGSQLHLTAKTTRTKFHSDLPASPAFGFNDMSYLGPTIEAHVDEPGVVTLTNAIDGHPFGADLDTSIHGVSESWRTRPPTNLHLHGGVTAPDSDGHPQRLLLPGGGTATHFFPHRQEAGHLWYHDHAMGITRANVAAGLAGMYFLRDEYDTGRANNPLGLPAEDHEMPLILQEKVFTPDGRQSLRSTPVVPEGGWEGGAVGDVGLVNGKVWPQLKVDRGLYRFRLINAASFSLWNLFFSNRMQFWVIGNDHGLLGAPEPVRSLKVSPAERYDLLVDFSGLSAGETVELCNDEAPPFQAAILGEVAMPVFCRFKSTGGTGFTKPVPTELRGGPGLPEVLPPLAKPTSERTVTVSQPYALRIPPAIMSLNNLRFSDPQIEKPKQGTTEIWNIVNITDDPHPIHIHLVTFRILGRTPLRTVEYQAAHPQPAIGVKWTPDPTDFLAGPMVVPARWEAGWKDTVRVDPGTVTRIVVRFPTAEELQFDPDATFSSDPTVLPVNLPVAEPPVADEPVAVEEGPALPAPAPTPPAPAHHQHSDEHGGTPAKLQGYVWHCHLLDHEDHDMMLRFRTVE